MVTSSAGHHEASNTVVSSANRKVTKAGKTEAHLKMAQTINCSGQPMITQVQHALLSANLSAAQQLPVKGLRPTTQGQVKSFYLSQHFNRFSSNGIRTNQHPEKTFFYLFTQRNFCYFINSGVLFVFSLAFLLLFCLYFL